MGGNPQIWRAGEAGGLYIPCKVAVAATMSGMLCSFLAQSPVLVDACAGCVYHEAQFRNALLPTSVRLSGARASERRLSVARRPSPRVCVCVCACANFNPSAIYEWPLPEGCSGTEGTWQAPPCPPANAHPRLLPHPSLSPLADSTLATHTTSQ